jgi:hypothetical protein
MNPKRHFDTSNVAQSEAIHIWKMIVDLDRTVQILSCDITTEEESAGISDRSDPSYPILARTLATRRDNLKDTVAALEHRLSELDQADMFRMGIEEKTDGQPRRQRDGEGRASPLAEA